MIGSGIGSNTRGEVMKTIETIASVGEDRMFRLRLPNAVAPGTHKIVVVIEDGTVPRPALPSTADFPSHDLGPWRFAPDKTFWREDLYGDDGR